LAGLLLRSSFSSSEEALTNVFVEKLFSVFRKKQRRGEEPELRDKRVQQS